MRIGAHATRSSIHVGNSSERCVASPSRLQRATRPLAFSITSWTLTTRPAHGCHGYRTSRFSVLWVFWIFVVQSNEAPFGPRLYQPDRDGAKSSLTPSTNSGEDHAGVLLWGMPPLTQRRPPVRLGAVPRPWWRARPGTNPRASWRDCSPMRKKSPTSGGAAGGPKPGRRRL